MVIHAPPLPLPAQPVNRIPVETLAAILTFTLPPFNYAQTPQRGSLALVCRRWNAVIESTPFFWTRISCQDSLAQVEKALMKSKDCPIDLYSDWPYSGIDGRPGPSFRIRFLQLVNCHIQRWRHVTLDVRSEDTFPLSSTPAPSLESLEVFCWALNGEEAEVPRQITMVDGTTTPRLREIYIDGLGVLGWNKPFPPTLSELAVKNMDRGPSFSELFTILISCPRITILELSNVEVDLPPDQGWASAPLVEFAALRSLTLCDLGDQVTQNILQRLRFPTTCVVKVFSDLETPHPSTSLASMLSHHINNPNDVVIDQLTIWIRENSDVIIAEGPRWSITFELDDTEATRDAVLWFKNHGATGRSDPPQPSTCTITVSLDIDYNVVADGFEFLSPITDLPCITKIALNNAGLAILSSPVQAIMAQGDKQIWPFPNARELHFKQPDAELHPVIQLVEKRRGESDELGAAAPLQKITFGDEFRTVKPAQPDSLLTIMDIMDEGAQVYWYGKQVLRDR